MEDEQRPYTSETGNKEHDPVETGRKAIDADGQINQQDKEHAQRRADEEKDAETWRNEG